MNPQGVNINIATIPNLFCKNIYDKIDSPNKVCGSIFFDKTVIAKNVPALLSGSNQDTIVEIPILICHSCGTVLEQHLKLIKNISPELELEETKKLIG